MHLWDCYGCRAESQIPRRYKRTKAERLCCHCPYEDRGEWLPWRSDKDIPFPMTVAGRPIYERRDDGTWSPDVCPGFLLNQPLVAEVGEAFGTFEKGNFDAFYPNAANVLCEGVIELARAVSAFTAEKMRQKQDPAQVGEPSL